jgi:hypothetical protein
MQTFAARFFGVLAPAALLCAPALAAAEAPVTLGVVTWIEAPPPIEFTYDSSFVTALQANPGG